jgi:signal transduction histidine kinase/ActR/RegA family two-component response regulator
VGAVGICGLAGWIFGNDILKGVFVKGVTIKPNAAIGLILVAVSVELLRPGYNVRWKVAIGYLLAGTAACIGGLTFLEHLLNFDFGIDQFLWSEPPGAAATVSPNRMGPPASLSLMLAGSSLLLVRVRKGAITQSVGVLISLISLIPLLGYAYGIPPLYDTSRYTGIAAHTACALLAMSVALVTMLPEAPLGRVIWADDAGGIMARRLLLPVLLLPLVTGWARSYAGQRGWIDAALGRPLVALVLALSMGILVVLNARSMSALERRRRETERVISAQLLEAKQMADEARERAEKASRAKSEFLAMLSHEIRTPLTPVMLTLSLIEKNTNLSPELRDHLLRAKESLNLEIGIISDLLDVTRIEQNKLALDTAEVDLHAVIRDAAAVCVRGEAAQVVLHLNAPRHWVSGDSARLHQIFWNLLNNAQKFTPRGGNIRVTSALTDDCIEVCVADTGFGIEPDVLQKLFRPFEQGMQHNQASRMGLGLGLAISRRLAEAHGGEIVASSEGKGKGAMFTVRLPVLPVNPATSAPVPSPSGVATEPLVILLVEDHQPTRAVLTRLLQGLGHEVAPASCVADAVKIAQSQAIDVLISDLGLPDGTGIDILSQAGKNLGERAIALTGYGSAEDLEATRRAGFAEHLTKPIEFAALERTLKRLAGRPTRISEPTERRDLASSS